jgi:NAD dependent epimerase/dehydratase family enzyme
LRLACVREKLPEGAEPDEEQLFEALRELLRDAIEKLGSEQSRIILRIVLSLEPGTLELSLRERREKAGLEFRRGRQTVTWGTIRSYHERRAIDQLAKMIFGMEQSASTPPLFDDGT